MFNFFKKNKDNAPKKNYNLEYDNLAIPEIKIHKNHNNVNDTTNDNLHENNENKDTINHTSASHNSDTGTHNKNQTDVTYDSVAIPEVHIRKKH